MKITGLTIVRNAVLNDFPITEAISSILPLVDEMIISIDKGDDDTEGLIRSIVSDKIRIVYSTWDMTLRKGGQVYAIETNKAMQHVSADTDWIFYIQADEVIHEKYHEVIREEAAKYRDDKRVDGLLFRYRHFYGTYSYIADNRGWYDCEVRLVKNERAISSYKDAQGFRRNGKKINAVRINAEVYHYGWVKSLEQMKKKLNSAAAFYQPDDVSVEKVVKENDLFDFNTVDYIKPFEDTHPAVMKKRITAQNLQISPGKKRRKVSLKNKLLRWLEDILGRKLFVFRNYQLLSNK